MIGRCHLAAAEIARQRNIENGYRTVLNVGPGAGQSVFHPLSRPSVGWTFAGLAAGIKTLLSAFAKAGSQLESGVLPFL